MFYCLLLLLLRVCCIFYRSWTLTRGKVPIYPQLLLLFLEPHTLMQSSSVVPCASSPEHFYNLINYQDFGIHEILSWIKFTFFRMLYLFISLWVECVRSDKSIKFLDAGLICALFYWFHARGQRSRKKLLAIQWFFSTKIKPLQHLVYEMNSFEHGMNRVEIKNQGFCLFSSSLIFIYGQFWVHSIPPPLSWPLLDSQFCANSTFLRKKEPRLFFIETRLTHEHSFFILLFGCIFCDGNSIKINSSDTVFPIYFNRIIIFMIEVKNSFFL